jgi:hypothetical protein
MLWNVYFKSLVSFVTAQLVEALNAGCVLTEKERTPEASMIYLPPSLH